MKKLFYRILPLLLAATLQVMPLVRWLLPATNNGLAPSAWSIILKIGTGATALLGAYDAIAGATVGGGVANEILPPVNGGFKVLLTNGVFFKVKNATSPDASGSWTPNRAENTTTATFTLFPGFSLTNATGYMGGAPATASSGNLTNVFSIYAWGTGLTASQETFTNFTFVVLPAIPGSVTVTAGPPALAALARNITWSLDGVWQTNASTNIFVNPGTHTVNFTNVYGWSAPTSQVVNITSGVQTRFSLVYTQLLGGLQVNLQPRGQAQTAGTWTIDGSPAYGSGTITNLSQSGTHALTFGAVPGYTSPAAQTIAVTNGFTNVVTAVYLSTTLGTVLANLSPASAVSAGALWQIDGGPWLTSSSATNCSLATHTISFSSVPGWVAPTNQTVSVTGTGLVTVAAAYTQAPNGAVQVTLTPPGAVTAGAKWELDGGAPEPSGTTVGGVTTGSHTVYFTAVNGWLAPSSQTFSVTAGQTNAVTANYVTISAPVIATAALSGTSLVISGSGTPNASYSILATNDLTIPLLNWPLINAGTINANGIFSYTGIVNIATPATFYRVRSP